MAGEAFKQPFVVRFVRARLIEHDDVYSRKRRLVVPERFSDDAL
jgi:hypothetical protein